LHDHLSTEDEEEEGFIPAAQLKPDDFKVPLSPAVADGRRSINLMRCTSFGILIRESGKRGMMMTNSYVMSLKMEF